MLIDLVKISIHTWLYSNVGSVVIHGKGVAGIDYLKTMTTLKTASCQTAEGTYFARTSV